MTPGVLISSDEQTIVFITALDEQASPRFIIRALDSTHVFVRSSAVPAINSALHNRLMATVFSDDGEAEAS